MKILILNWRDLRHPRAGGAELHLHEIFRRIAAKGHEVHVLSSAFESCKSLENFDGLEIHRFGSNWNFNLLAIWKLRKFLAELKPDILVEDLNKVPFYTPILLRFLPKEQRPRLVIQMHHLWRKSIFSETGFLGALYVWMQEKLIPLVYGKARFIVVSESTRSELEQSGIPGTSIRVIHNGNEPRACGQKQKEEPFFLWIGRLQKYKGISDALTAFAEFHKTFPNYRLLVAGSGPFRDTALRHTQTLGISDNVEFLGFVKETKKYELMGKATAILQTSRKEGWGLTVIEANGVGCPAIGNNAPGLCDSIRDGETGLLYSFNDTTELSNSMKLLVENAELRDSLAGRALQWSRQFTWERAAEESLEYLESHR